MSNFTVKELKVTGGSFIDRCMRNAIRDTERSCSSEQFVTRSKLIPAPANNRAPATLRTEIGINSDWWDYLHIDNVITDDQNELSRKSNYWATPKISNLLRFAGYAGLIAALGIVFFSREGAAGAAFVGLALLLLGS